MKRVRKEIKGILTIQKIRRQQLINKKTNQKPKGRADHQISLKYLYVNSEICLRLNLLKIPTIMQFIN